MKATRDHSQTMQRVRVGMIGLLAVIVLIALASAIIGSAARAPGGNMAASVATNFAVGNGQDEAGEPLAELGAAPGVTNDQTAAP